MPKKQSSERSKPNPNLDPRDCFVVGIAPDIHVPDHNVAACNAVVKILESAWFDAFVQLGDFFDHEQIGRFVRDQPAKLVHGLLDDWQLGKALWNRMRAAARAHNEHARVDQIEGNHETRLIKYESYHPQLRGLLNLREQLGIDEDPLADWIPSDSRGHVLRYVQTSNGIVRRVVQPDHAETSAEFGLTCLHGWSHAMHSAKMTADMAPWPGPIVYGHVHNESSFTGKRFGWLKPQAYTIGSLGNLTPEYVMGRPTPWVASVAKVYLAKKHPGTYRVNVIRISQGRAINDDGRLIVGEEA